MLNSYENLVVGVPDESKSQLHQFRYEHFYKVSNINKTTWSLYYSKQEHRFEGR